MDREEDLIRERVEKDQEKLYKRAKKMQKTDKYVIRGAYSFIGGFIAIIFAIFIIISLINYHESKPKTFTSEEMIKNLENKYNISVEIVETKEEDGKTKYKAKASNNIEFLIVKESEKNYYNDYKDFLLKKAFEEYEGVRTNYSVSQSYDSRGLLNVKVYYDIKNLAEIETAYQSIIDLYSNVSSIDDPEIYIRDEDFTVKALYNNQVQEYEKYKDIAKRHYVIFFTDNNKYKNRFDENDISTYYLKDKIKVIINNTLQKYEAEYNFDKKDYEIYTGNLKDLISVTNNVYEIKTLEELRNEYGLKITLEARQGRVIINK
jgi:hypothetical protein